MLVLLLFLPWRAKRFLIFKKLAAMASDTAIPKIVPYLVFLHQRCEDDTIFLVLLDLLPILPQVTQGLCFMIKNGLKNIPANFYVNWVRNFKDMALSSFDNKRPCQIYFRNCPGVIYLLNYQKLIFLGTFFCV